MSFLPNLPGPAAAVLVGASGGLGRAFLEHLAQEPPLELIVATSRDGTGPDHARVRWQRCDLTLEPDIAALAETARSLPVPLRLVIVASGVLHDGERLQPEKSWRALEPEALVRAYRVNAVGPALVGKHLLPLLPRQGRAVFAAISARVGSIGDNRSGGWHAYRASKAALNMLLRNHSIELARRNAEALCVGLHPGTVATALSAPFRSGVAEDQLLAPSESAARLLQVLDRLPASASGGLYAHDGAAIPF